MNTIEIIKLIAQHPEREVVVINENDDMYPQTAIIYLCNLLLKYPDEKTEWKYLMEEKSTLLIYS